MEAQCAFLSETLPMLDKLLQGGEGGCSESVYNMAKAMALEGNNILMARIRAGSFYKRLACTEGVDPDVLYDYGMYLDDKLRQCFGEFHYENDTQFHELRNELKFQACLACLWER